MASLARVGLGTAQFGADYGISNRDGRPSETEVAAILERAFAAGIGYLDTASSYGDAETLIGKHLPVGHQLRIVTKLPPIADVRIEARHKKSMLDALAGSLDRLKAPQVYGLLIHHSRDLTKPGWQYMVESLCEARDHGWTIRIGVSIYDAADLELLDGRLKLDLVQLPFNALDRRLAASGWLTRLKSQGIEVHARSLFLQGLLLMEPAKLPGFFAPARGLLADLHNDWAAKKLTPLAGCLSSVLANTEIDAAIVGVNRLRELAEIEAAVAEFVDQTGDAAPVAIDPIYLDPRQWPARGQ